MIHLSIKNRSIYHRKLEIIGGILIFALLVHSFIKVKLVEIGLSLIAAIYYGQLSYENKIDELRPIIRIVRQRKMFCIVSALAIIIPVFVFSMACKYYQPFNQIFCK